MWVIGFAQTGKAGPLVETDVGPVYASDIHDWPAELVGRPVIVEGTLSTVHHGSTQSADGTVRGGLSGDQMIVSTSKPPPLVDDGLLDAERNLVAAFERKDRASLEKMISPRFRLHINGKVRTRDDMLKSILVPELEKVGVVSLQSHRSGGVGIVSGKQEAKVRDNGALTNDDNYFVDVFERDGDRWILTIAYAK